MEILDTFPRVFCFRKSRINETFSGKCYKSYAPVIGFPEGGGPQADVGTLLIVHFKVLVFPHPWGLFFLQSPHYLAKPSTQLDLKMHLRTLFWLFEQLANTQTLHSDEN